MFTRLWVGVGVGDHFLYNSFTDSLVNLHFFILSFLLIYVHGCSSLKNCRNA